MAPPLRLLVVGAGKVGTNLARLAASRGQEVTLWNPVPLSDEVQAAVATAGDVTVVVSTPPEGSYDLALLSVTDTAVAKVAIQVDGWQAAAGRPLAHTSGSVGTLGLESGRAVGVCHPAFAFPSPNLPITRLQAAAFLVDGDETTCQAFAELVQSWGSAAVRGPGTDRVLYHAACVTASNFLALLGDDAGDLLAAAGVPEEGRNQLLFSLMESVLAHAREADFFQAMTGPAARGDVATLIAEATGIGRTAPDQFNLFLEANLALLQRHGHTAATEELLAWAGDMDEE